MLIGIAKMKKNKKSEAIDRTLYGALIQIAFVWSWNFAINCNETELKHYGMQSTRRWFCGESWKLFVCIVGAIFFCKTTYIDYVQKSVTVEVQRFDCVSWATDWPKNANFFVPKGPINWMILVLQRFMTFFSNGKSDQKRILDVNPTFKMNPTWVNWTPFKWNPNQIVVQDSEWINN